MLKPIYRFLNFRFRFIISFLIGVIIAYILPDDLIKRSITRVIVGWNIGALTYLIFAARIIFWTNTKKMQSRAKNQDKTKMVILIFTVLAVFAALSSIIIELTMVRKLDGILKYEHMLFALISIAISWTFTHVMFAIHYAHDYYVN